MRAPLAAAAVLALVLGCDSADPPPAGSPAGQPSSASPAPALPTATGAPPGAPPPTSAVLVGAGDIATCDSTRRDEATASLVAQLPGTVATFGDNAYPDGSARDFERCYAPSWGRLRDRTRPALGNHDHRTTGAAGYFDYFGRRAGPPGRGYYSYSLGPWHIVVLDSTCSRVGCDAGSAQERWLRADLSAHPTRCTLAYWHHPLYTSGATHGPDRRVRPLFQALYDAGAELVLSAHNHQYERFAPMDAHGRLDRARGVRQLVVGTGGASLYAFGRTQDNSERRVRAFGVVRLTLRPTAYDWEFLPASGASALDRGTTSCH